MRMAPPPVRISELVRPELLELRAYHLDLAPVAHKLDQNEVPFDWPRRLKRQVLERLFAQPWQLYPDFHSDALRAALGRLCAWPAAGILVGNGSNELLATALEACARPGREVLGVAPSFSLYRALVLRAAAVPRFLPAGDDLRLPLAALEREVERDPTRPVLLCSPNNPTGEAVPPETLERLLERLEAPLVLDNAYHEFCEHDYRPLLDRNRHLILMRTFSKAWGLGGLRVGYLLADPELVEQLIKVKLPYNLNLFSATAAETVLAQPEALERRLRVIRGRRRQWAAMLAALGFEVFPSQANFLLVRHPEIERVRAELDRRSIRIRKLGGHPALDLCARFSVGNGRSLRAVRHALEEIL